MQDRAFAPLNAGSDIQGKRMSIVCKQEQFKMQLSPIGEVCDVESRFVARERENSSARRSFGWSGMWLKSSSFMSEISSRKL